MSRSRTWMLPRVAWLCAIGATISAPGHSADLVSTSPRLLSQYEEGLQPLYDTPLLLAVPQDCAAVGLDFVPPVPQVAGQRSVAPATPVHAQPQRLPAETQPTGLASNASGYVAKPQPQLPPMNVRQRLPAVESSPTPIRVASRPAESGLLIDRIDNSSPRELAPPTSPRSLPTATAPATPAQPPRTPMMAVSERAFGITQNAAALADRGANFSARADFIQALRVVTQALDAQSGDNLHSQALADGLRALTEADDFAPHGSQLEADLDLASIVASHRTPVLKHDDLTTITPLHALQRYYSFAQQRLTTACEQEPAAAEALFGLGRLTVLMAEQSADARRLHAPKAMTLYHAALVVDPRHARAAHELGVLYAEFGQLEDAHRLLVMSVNLSSKPESWHNLAVVHQRLGEADLARKARYEMQLCLQSRGHRDVASKGIAVEWVEPTQFAAQSGPAHAPAARSAARPQTSPSANPWLK